MGRLATAATGDVRALGLPVSLILIAVGAILAFAVNQSDPNPPVDVDVVGWILMLVGLVGGLLSFMLWDRLGPGALGWHRGGYAALLRAIPAMRRVAAQWSKKRKRCLHRAHPARRRPNRPTG